MIKIWQIKHGTNDSENLGSCSIALEATAYKRSHVSYQRIYTPLESVDGYFLTRTTEPDFSAHGRRGLRNVHKYNSEHDKVIGVISHELSLEEIVEKTRDIARRFAKSLLINGRWGNVLHDDTEKKQEKSRVN